MGAPAFAREEERPMKILPQDPLVRWLIWLVVGFSLGAPLIVALVLAIES